MSRFNGFLRWASSILIISALAFTLGGCEGSDGAAGAAGAAGAPGADGPAGPPGPPGAGSDAIAAAKPGSCATCHSGVGDGHKAVYDKYADASDLAMTFNSLTSVPGAVAGQFAVTRNCRIPNDGTPLLALHSRPPPRVYLSREFVCRWHHSPRH